MAQAQEGMECPDHKHLKKEYQDAGFRFCFCHEQGNDKFERVERMVQDIILRSWEIAQGQVLANISEEQMVYVLETMKSRGDNAVFAHSHTHVFWDVDDWPTPNFENPRMIFRNIKIRVREELHAQEEGYYNGRLTAMAYGEAFKTMSEDLKKEYIHAGFTFYYEEVDKFGRMASMLEDILLCTWQLRQGQVVNIVVLAKISEEHMVYVFKIMKSRGHNVVFARKRQSQEDDDSSVTSLIGRLSEFGISEWICPNLLDEILEDL
ncbi:unnamed protein product [Microthlaspi erraticum]|uniref:Uncharacterized protein n=1 Tax=Microthlaspi erraticum TaxID=1685480 RepID=A0A6D2I9D7_9BRAS|nr:unnamed protein product [Microthlaspi erraticum]